MASTTSALSSQGSIFVTGANGGLACSLISKLLSSPDIGSFYGIYAVRDPAAAPALTRVLQSPGSKALHAHEVVGLDLVHLDRVREVATDINTRVVQGKIPSIRMLVLNAGYLEFEQTRVEGGLDKIWVVNYLSQWLLTMLLLQSLDREHGQVVIVGSATHNPTDADNHGVMGGFYADQKWTTRLDNGVAPIAQGQWGLSVSEGDVAWHAGLRRYGASKLCLAMMVGELQHRLDRDPQLSNISVLGFDPGWMATPISRRHPQYTFTSTVMPLVARVCSKLRPNGMFRTTERSATDLLSLVLGADTSHTRGRYYKGGVLTEVNEEARDEEKRRLVWRESVKYAQLQEDETALAHCQ